MIDQGEVDPARVRLLFEPIDPLDENIEDVEMIKHRPASPLDMMYDDESVAAKSRDGSNSSIGSFTGSVITTKLLHQTQAIQKFSESQPIEIMADVWKNTATNPDHAHLTSISIKEFKEARASSGRHRSGGGGANNNNNNNSSPNGRVGVEDDNASSPVSSSSSTVSVSVSSTSTSDNNPMDDSGKKIKKKMVSSQDPFMIVGRNEYVRYQLSGASNRIPVVIASLHSRSNDDKRDNDDSSIETSPDSRSNYSNYSAGGGGGDDRERVLGGGGDDLSTGSASTSNSLQAREFFASMRDNDDTKRAATSDDDGDEDFKEHFDGDVGMIDQTNDIIPSAHISNSSSSNTVMQSAEQVMIQEHEGEGAATTVVVVVDDAHSQASQSSSSSISHLSAADRPRKDSTSPMQVPRIDSTNVSIQSLSNPNKSSARISPPAVSTEAPPSKKKKKSVDGLSSLIVTRDDKSETSDVSLDSDLQQANDTGLLFNTQRIPTDDSGNSNEIIQFASSSIIRTAAAISPSAKLTPGVSNKLNFSDFADAREVKHKSSRDSIDYCDVVEDHYPPHLIHPLGNIMEDDEISFSIAVQATRKPTRQSAACTTEQLSTESLIAMSSGGKWQMLPSPAQTSQQQQQQQLKKKKKMVVEASTTDGEDKIGLELSGRRVSLVKASSSIARVSDSDQSSADKPVDRSPSRPITPNKLMADLGLSPAEKKDHPFNDSSYIDPMTGAVVPSQSSIKALVKNLSEERELQLDREDNVKEEIELQSRISFFPKHFRQTKDSMMTMNKSLIIAITANADNNYSNDGAVATMEMETSQANGKMDIDAVVNTKPDLIGEADVAALEIRKFIQSREDALKVKPKPVAHITKPTALSEHYKVASRQADGVLLAASDVQHYKEAATAVQHKRKQSLVRNRFVRSPPSSKSRSNSPTALKESELIIDGDDTGGVAAVDEHVITEIIDRDGYIVERYGGPNFWVDVGKRSQNASSNTSVASSADLDQFPLLDVMSSPLDLTGINSFVSSSNNNNHFSSNYCNINNYASNTWKGENNEKAAVSPTQQKKLKKSSVLSTYTAPRKRNVRTAEEMDDTATSAAVGDYGEVIERDFSVELDEELWLLREGNNALPLSSSSSSMIGDMQVGAESVQSKELQLSITNAAAAVESKDNDNIIIRPPPTSPVIPTIFGDIGSIDIDNPINLTRFDYSDLKGGRNVAPLNSKRFGHQDKRNRPAINMNLKIKKIDHPVIETIIDENPLLDFLLLRPRSPLKPFAKSLKPLPPTERFKDECEIKGNKVKIDGSKAMKGSLSDGQLGRGILSSSHAKKATAALSSSLSQQQLQVQRATAAVRTPIDNYQIQLSIRESTAETRRIIHEIAGDYPYFASSSTSSSDGGGGGGGGTTAAAAAAVDDDDESYSKSTRMMMRMMMATNSHSHNNNNLLVDSSQLGTEYSTLDPPNMTPLDDVNNYYFPIDLSPPLATTNATSTTTTIPPTNQQMQLLLPYNMDTSSHRGPLDGVLRANKVTTAPRPLSSSSTRRLKAPDNHNTSSMKIDTDMSNYPNNNTTTATTNAAGMTQCMTSDLKLNGIRSSLNVHHHHNHHLDSNHQPDTSLSRSRGGSRDNSIVSSRFNNSNHFDDEVEDEMDFEEGTDDDNDL
jgi:hypothetical protein